MKIMKKMLLAGATSGLLLACATAANAGPITVGAGWYGFCFAGVGSPATAGCQNSGIGVSGNSTTFTAVGNVDFNVTDAFNKGDTFKVVVNGTPYFTSAVPAVAGNVSNPAIAFLDPTYSSISIALGAGAYTVDIFDTASPFGSGGAYLEAVVGVPEPLTLSLFGVGTAGLVAMRRRKKKVA
jgi:hypothetical protein